MPKKRKREILQIGKIYTGKYAKKEYKMEVVEENGRIRFKVNKTIFKSPSGAAKSIINHEVNGWRFWKMDK